MKSTNRFLMASVLASVLLIGSAHAAPQRNGNGGYGANRPQSGGHQPGQGHGQTKVTQALSQLGLSEAQEAQLRPVLASTHEKIQALRQQETPEKGGLLVICQETFNSINAVLTPEQRTKLDELRAQNRPKRSHRWAKP